MPTPTGSCSKKWFSASEEFSPSACNRGGSSPWLASMGASRSIYETTHLPTETSVPTYMKSATANSQNAGLRKSSFAPLSEDDSGFEGRGKRGTRIITNSTTVMAPSDQKIEDSPPYC